MLALMMVVFGLTMMVAFRKAPKDFELIKRLLGILIFGDSLHLHLVYSYLLPRYGLYASTTLLNAGTTLFFCTGRLVLLRQLSV